MTPRREQHAAPANQPAIGLPAGASWTMTDAVALGTAHITNFPTASRHAESAIGMDGLVATPHASRDDTTQALTLLLGTLGILFGLALLAGSPVPGIR
jgi:hypothetical protein